MAGEQDPYESLRQATSIGGETNPSEQAMQQPIPAPLLMQALYRLFGSQAPQSSVGGMALGMGTGPVGGGYGKLFPGNFKPAARFAGSLSHAIPETAEELPGMVRQLGGSYNSKFSNMSQYVPDVQQRISNTLRGNPRGTMLGIAGDAPGFMQAGRQPLPYENALSADAGSEQAIRNLIDQLVQRQR